MGKLGPFADFAKQVLSDNRMRDREIFAKIIIKAAKSKCKFCDLGFHDAVDCIIPYIAEDTMKAHGLVKKYKV